MKLRQKAPTALWRKPQGPENHFNFISFSACVPTIKLHKNEKNVYLFCCGYNQN